jgi:hypothetical protein
MHADENHEMDLAPQEQDALRGARVDYSPPLQIEARIRQELRRRGLLVSPPAWRNWRLPGALVLMVLAFALGIRWKVPLPRAESRPRFILLLYEDPSNWKGTSEDHAKLVKEYGAWARTLERRGALITADELDRSATVLTSANLGGTVAILEQNGQLDGFFLIAASDESEALAIARTCPHLRYGGRVAVQKIVI